MGGSCSKCRWGEEGDAKERSRREEIILNKALSRSLLLDESREVETGEKGEGGMRVERWS